MNKDHFQKLLRGNIIGIIDAHGAVHSKFTGENVFTHDSTFPGQTHKKWRWNHRESIHWFVSEEKLNDEEYSAVQNHLTKTYGLEWWENGHHDIDHLLKKVKE